MAEGNGILARLEGVTERLGRHDESLKRLYERTDDLPGLRVELRTIAEDVKETRDEVKALRRVLVSLIATIAVSAIVFAASVIATRIGGG